jgi:hypothetical protein
MDFSPPMKDRPTIEIIKIAFGTTLDWQFEAIEAAKNELKDRKIEKNIIDKEVSKIKFNKEILQKKINRQNTIKENAKYENWQIALFIIFPFSIIKSHYFFTTSLWELKCDGYKTKYRQKLYSYIIGGLIWTLIIHFV